MAFVRTRNRHLVPNFWQWILLSAMIWACSQQRYIGQQERSFLTILTFLMQLECKSVPSNFILSCAYIACGILVNHRTYSQSACIPTTVKALSYNFTVFVPWKCRWRISFCFTQQGYRTSFQLPQKMNFWFICNEMRRFISYLDVVNTLPNQLKDQLAYSKKQCYIFLMLVFIYNRKTRNST